MQCDADNQPGSLGTQESDALMLTVFRGLVGGLHNCWVEQIRGKLDEKDMVRLVGEQASLAHVRHGPGRQETLSIIEMTRKTPFPLPVNCKLHPYVAYSDCGYRTEALPPVSEDLEPRCRPRKSNRTFVAIACGYSIE
jgi:hypothetical protein